MLLSSCAPVVQDLATAQGNPTNTPTLAIISTSTPSPTTTLSLIDKIFVLPTRLPYIGTTPTPIATSALGSSSMRLRNLSEGEFINLITDLQERSYRSFPPYDDWWSEGQFDSSQESVALAIQEYLYHFPDSLDADRLRWQLAFIDSIMFEDLKGNEYYDDWMIEQLQSRLNQNGVLPSDLESVLDKYWFEVDYFQPIENLFGDGKTAWFYVVSPQVWADEEDYQKSPDYFHRGGLFFIVREMAPGRFQLYILDNAWSFSNGSSSLFEISDFNQNGIPEIALNIGFHGGTFCSGNLKIFEWQDDAFADLTRGDIRVSDCVDNYEYTTVDGAPAIRFDKFFMSIPSVYIWNGSYYEFSGYEYSTLVEKWVAATLDPQNSFSEETEAIEAILSSENMEGLSSAHGDFLRFRLGIAYALTSEVSQARKVLQDLADNPLSTNTEVL